MAYYHGQNNKPSSRNGSGNNNDNMSPLPRISMNEEHGFAGQNNGQNFRESSSVSRGGNNMNMNMNMNMNTNMNMMGQGVGGGFMINKGGPMGSWGGGQRIPPSYRGNMCNDVDSQPAGDSMYSNYGRYSNNNYSNPGRGGLGFGNFQGDDESINYLAARAHAAQMLAAEESRRLEENLMMLEMRRRMMTGDDGSGTMEGGDRGLNGNQGQGQGPRGGPSETSPRGNDSILMARAQKFNMPQSMDMVDGSSNNGQQQCMGVNSNWNNACIARNFPQCSSPSNDPPPFPPFNSGEAMKSPGEAFAAGQVFQSSQRTTAIADSPKKTKTIDAPRRPLSAYNIFFSEMREIILKGKEGGEETDSKDESKKKAAEAGEGDAKKPAGEESPKDMEAFTQSLMKKRLKKDPPKRAHRKSHGKVAFTTLAKTVGQRWRELPEDRKKKYRDLAEIDRARYRREKLGFGKALREEAKKQRKEAKARQMQK